MPPSRTERSASRSLLAYFRANGRPLRLRAALCLALAEQGHGGGAGRAGERPVEGRERRAQPPRKLEVSGIVERQPVDASEREHRPAVGLPLDSNRQTLQIGEEFGRAGLIDAAPTLAHQEDV